MNAARGPWDDCEFPANDRSYALHSIIYRHYYFTRKKLIKPEPWDSRSHALHAVYIPDIYVALKSVVEVNFLTFLFYFPSTDVEWLYFIYILRIYVTTIIIYNRVLIYAAHSLKVKKKGGKQLLIIVLYYIILCTPTYYTCTVKIFSIVINIIL